MVLFKNRIACQVLQQFETVISFLLRKQDVNHCKTINKEILLR